MYIYNNKGFRTNVYKSNDIHLGDVFDIKGNLFQANYVLMIEAL